MSDDTEKVYKSKEDLKNEAIKKKLKKKRQYVATGWDDGVY